MPLWARVLAGRGRHALQHLGLLDHLDAIRRQLTRVALWVALGAVGGWVLQPDVFAILEGMVRDALPEALNYREAFASMVEPFFLKLKMAVLIGLFLAAPVVLLDVWLMLRRFLKPEVRGAVLRLVPVSGALFIAGAGAGLLAMPAILGFLTFHIMQFPGASLYQQVGSLVTFVLQTMALMGLGFQLPVVVFLIGALGLISVEAMLASWRQVIVVIFVLAGVLTPPDPVSIFVLALPMSLLYGLSLLVLRLGPRPKLEDAREG